MANCSPTVVAGLASCFTCLTPAQRQTAAIFLLCRLTLTGGIGQNLVPNGSVYGGGATPEFDLTVLANTSYNIVWGSNDLSMTLGTTTYTSLGAGHSSPVWTAGNTVMKFFGTFAGTTVTVRVLRYPGIPAVSGLTVAPAGTGTTVIASWDAIPNIPATPITQTEVWTSPDNVTFALAGTVAAPGTSLSGITAPTLGNTLYVKARWDSGVTLLGPFSPSITMAGSISDWAKRVVANGGALPSAGTCASMQTFYNTLVSQSLLSFMLEVCCFVPDNLIACITPLIKTHGADPWTNHNFVAGDVSVNGLTGNASNKYLDLGFTPSTGFTSNNNGMGLYVYANGTTPGYMFGADGAGGTIEAILDSSGNIEYGSQTIYFTVPLTVAGFWCGNRLSSTNMALYFANSSNAWTQKGSSASASGALTAHPVYLMALDSGGSPSNYSNATIAFAALYFGLSSAHGQALFNAVQALRTALGGGYV